MVRFENIDVSGERVEIGDGVTIPTSWTTVVRGEEGVPGTIHVIVEYDPELNRAVAAEVRVQRGFGADEVTSITLRQVRVQHAVQVGGLKASTVSEPGHPIATGGDYIRRMRERTDRTTAESVVDAARTYQLAASISLPPLRAVADCLAVSQSTATRLMNRARAEGLATGVEFAAPSMQRRIASPQPPASMAQGPTVPPVAPSGPSIGM